jgi:hypothetical protein
MPIDYAIGVGTFVPNNAVIIHEDGDWRPAIKSKGLPEAWS